MGSRDPRVDAYIARSADFAQPILTHIRETVHAACPGTEETMKWSFPHFMFEGMLCSMAAFKAHCAFGFWKGRLIVGPDAMAAEKAMGQFGRVTRLSDLPPTRVLAGYIRKAARLNAQRVKAPARPRPGTKPAARVPVDLARALARNARARATFEGWSPSRRREYIEWITEAKTDATRGRRLATAVRWIAEGKPRNWKYLKA